VAALLLGGCGGAIPIPEGPGSEADYLKGERLVQQERWLQATESLERFRTEHPGSDRIDDAIFLLGKAHQGAGDHLLAREEFDRLLRDFPQSEHREAAQFERAMSWLAEVRGPALDPQPTEEALEALRTYLRLYPEGGWRTQAEAGIAKCLDRLAVKSCLNGETYLRLGHPEAALIYFEKSLEILPTSSRAGEALLGLGRAHEARGDLPAAREAFERALAYATSEGANGNGGLRDVRRDAEEALARLKEFSEQGP